MEFPIANFNLVAVWQLQPPHLAIRSVIWVVQYLIDISVQDRDIYCQNHSGHRCRNRRGIPTQGHHTV